MSSRKKLVRAIPVQAIYDATRVGGEGMIPGPEALSAARRLFDPSRSRYAQAAHSPPVFGQPHPLAPEFALCGRSNVGKSSLANAPLRNTGMMLASKTPGRTRAIHVAEIAPGPTMSRVLDLPGYGCVAFC